MQFNMFTGLFGLIIFALDVWAIAQIINSGAERTSKIIWVLVVAILPVVGLIAWYFAGPKSNIG
ncbi:PLD nuclease N-terminal domain-containing protein [Paracoccus aerodenitrificans]|uniref:PLD nuclease N-terminal domain-containing protein n=1 Tax=Paracoccus aerodenitrificans TaxID=3017781 RepID=UPI0022F04CC4|nr:PLD nuclease N-terminal domain-containing protein [Paracoccus aerodenitrificans]WBU63812.1 PLD nuclease N-terminal domain-containing protein [Paracoccus aerodenitrificans]